MKQLILALASCLPLSLIAQKPVTLTAADGNKLTAVYLPAYEKITWGGYEQIGIAARSENDGKANTLAIVTAVGGNKGYDGAPYAAKVCDTLTLGGFTDWYLPASEETKLIQQHFAELKIDEKATIWSSTEANGTQAVTMYMYSGAFYNMQKVDRNSLVCVRKPD